MSKAQPLDGTEPVERDEIVFRRVLVRQRYYKRDADYLSAKAFNPRSVDTSGISILRSRYLPEPRAEAAGNLGCIGEDFWVIELIAGDFISAGMDIRPEPTSQAISHACIPVLNAKDADSSAVKAFTDAASRFPRKVHGPFPGRMPKGG